MTSNFKLSKEQIGKLEQLKREELEKKRLEELNSPTNRMGDESLLA